ncbi:MAG: hypothetical protein HGA87_03615, partial [Desulfobulbaceae bacterium]|nr:hypothetical protein [Desulfobulbaceae bacterium]
MSLPKIIIVSLIYCMSVFNVWADPDAMFTVDVIDEARTAVSNAEVHAGFVQSIQPGWGWGGGKEEIWRGVSDSNGMCVIMHECQGEAG